MAGWIIPATDGTSHDYTIQQTVTSLTPGDSCLLDFSISSEVIGGGAGYSSAVGPTFWNPWTAEQMSFVASASALTFRFKQLAIEFPGGEDPGLDAVDIVGAGTTAPEPYLVIPCLAALSQWAPERAAAAGGTPKHSAVPLRASIMLYSEACPHA
jgi:hypothetical protein